MAVTNYYTVDGEIIAEKTAGSSRIDYLTDALGSVTATVNQSGQLLNTYRYKPYGSLLAKTGTAPDPSFGWVGTQGYRPTQQKFSDFYVRARHYSENTGQWITKDPIEIGSELNAYLYVENNPVYNIDPTGNQMTACGPLSKNQIDAQLCKQLEASIRGNTCWNLCNTSQLVCSCSGSVNVSGNVAGIVTFPIPTGPFQKPCMYNKSFNCLVILSEKKNCTNPIGSKCTGSATCNLKKKSYTENNIAITGTIKWLSNVKWNAVLTVNATINGIINVMTCMTPSNAPGKISCNGNSGGSDIA